MTERLNLEELKAAAEAAFPAGYEVDESTDLVWLFPCGGQDTFLGPGDYPFLNLVAKPQTILALIAEVEALRTENEALRKQVYPLEPFEDGTGGVSWELVAFYNAAVINAAEEEIKQLQDGQSGTKRLRALLRQRYRPGDTVDLPTLRELGRTCGIQSDHVRAIANGERLRVIARPASPVDATHEQVIGGAP